MKESRSEKSLVFHQISILSTHIWYRALKDNWSLPRSPWKKDQSVEYFLYQNYVGQLLYTTDWDITFQNGIQNCLHVQTFWNMWFFANLSLHLRRSTENLIEKRSSHPRWNFGKFGAERKLKENGKSVFQSSKSTIIKTQNGLLNLRMLYSSLQRSFCSAAQPILYIVYSE